MYTKLGIFRKRDLSETCFELLLKREKIQFVPGDCLLVYGPDRQIRPYFIASGIQEPTVRLLIDKKASDIVDYLYGLRHGDMIRVDPTPKSLMPELIRAKDPMLIGEGFGLSPILSYLSSFPDKQSVTVAASGYPDDSNIQWLSKRHNLTDVKDLNITKKSNVYMFASQKLHDNILSSPGANHRRIKSCIIEPNP